MKRTEKYRDSDVFHLYNANPRNRIAGDCVIRAISTALQQSWEQTVRELTEVGIKHGLVCNEQACYDKYLKSKGWVKCKQPRKYDNTKYTGKEFCRELVRYDSEIYSGDDMLHIVAHIGTHHVVAIMSGQVWDTWDSTSGAIGVYWVKEG